MPSATCATFLSKGILAAFRLKYAERDVRDLSIEMLRECLSLLLNCDLSIKLSGGENMDRIALEKLFAQLLYVAHRGSVA